MERQVLIRTNSLQRWHDGALTGMAMEELRPPLRPERLPLPQPAPRTRA